MLWDALDAAVDAPVDAVAGRAEVSLSREDRAERDWLFAAQLPRGARLQRLLSRPGVQVLIPESAGRRGGAALPVNAGRPERAEAYLDRGGRRQRGERGRQGGQVAAGGLDGLVGRGLGARRPRQPAPQPGMPERAARRHAQLRVPLEAAPDEVEEEHVVAALERALQVLRAGRPAELAAAREPAAELDRAVGVEVDPAVARVALGADELARPLGLLQEPGRRHAQQLDYAGQLVGLVLAGQQREARQQLREDAAQRPHVDRHAVGRAEDHLGRPVEAALDVRVHPLVLVAARAEVYHLWASNGAIRGLRV